MPRQWIQFGGAGASGAVGGGGSSSTPDAPNVLSSSTVTVRYGLYGNASAYGFSGRIDLPTLVATYPHLAQIHIVATLPDGSQDQICATITGPFGAATSINYEGPIQYLQDGASHTISVKIVVENEAGKLTDPPITKTVTIQAAGVTGITSPREVSGSLTVDPITRLVSTTIGFTPVLASNQVPQVVTYYLSEDNGTSFVPIGWEVETSVGQEIQFKRLKPATAQTWKIAAAIGAIDYDPTVKISSGQLPAGAVISAGFSVAALGLPANNTVTCSIPVGTGPAANPYNVTTQDGFQYADIPGVTYNDPVGDVNAADVRITTQDLDANHLPIALEKPFAGSPVSGGSHTTDHLWANYPAVYVRYKCYVTNRVNQTEYSFQDATAATLITTAWSGADHLDVFIGATPTGQIDPTRFNAAKLDGTLANILGGKFGVRTGPGLSGTSSGLSVLSAPNGGVSVSAGGVSVQAGLGVSVGAGGVTVLAGAGVQVGAGGVSVQAGAGISVGVGGVTVIAGAGIQVGSGGVTVLAGAGLSVGAGGVSVQAAANSGISVTAGGVGVQAGNGVSVGAGGISVVAAANSGISVTAGGVGVQPGNGVSVGAGGLSVVAAANSGITVTTGGVGVQPGNGVAVGVGGLSVVAAANSGITVSAGGVGVQTGNGLTAGAGGLSVVAAANSGITVTAGGVAIQAAAGSGITLGPNGISVQADSSLTLGANGLGVKVNTSAGLTTSANGVGLNIATSSGVTVDSAGLRLNLSTNLTIDTNGSVTVNVGAINIGQLGGDFRTGQISSIQNGLNIGGITGSFRTDQINQIAGGINIGTLNGVLISQQVADGLLSRLSMFNANVFGLGILADFGSGTVRTSTTDTTNQLQNPHFEFPSASDATKPAYWSLPSGGVLDSTTYYTAPYSLRLGTSQQGAQSFPCKPGDQFSLQAYAKSDGNPSGTLFLQMNFYDANSNFLSFGGSGGGGYVTLGSTTAWTLAQTGVLTAPANAVKGEFRVTATGSGLWWVDNAVIARGVNKNMISSVQAEVINGVILAGQVTVQAATINGTIQAGGGCLVNVNALTGNLTAGMNATINIGALSGSISDANGANINISGGTIQNLTITSNNIQSVSVSKLTAGTITVSDQNIGAVTVKYATSARQCYHTASGIRAFNDVGQLTMSADMGGGFQIWNSSGTTSFWADTSGNVSLTGQLFLGQQSLLIQNGVSGGSHPTQVGWWPIYWSARPGQFTYIPMYA